MQQTLEQKYDSKEQKVVKKWQKTTKIIIYFFCKTRNLKSGKTTL